MSDEPKKEPKEEPKKPVKKKMVCPECGYGELFSEQMQSKQWIRGKEISWSGIAHTCLNPECGYFWRGK